MTLSTGKRIYRQHKTVDVKPLAVFIERKELHNIEVANYLGITGSAISTWLRNGKCPAWVPLALQSYDGEDIKSKSISQLILTIVNGKIASSRTLPDSAMFFDTDDAQTVTLNGVEFYLVKRG